jgi:hypothetical protein
MHILTQPTLIFIGAGKNGHIISGIFNVVPCCVLRIPGRVSIGAYDRKTKGQAIHFFLFTGS